MRYQSGSTLAAAGLAILCLPPLHAQPSPALSTAAALNRYCATCHNAKVKVAGLVINPTDAANPGSNAALWEKVIRKLRTAEMPPAGAPRPDPATYDAMASFLESEVDRTAAARPNPGKLPLLHRLSRTEYQNAIRDLLGLDAMPKELDYSLLLPPDNAGSGFDNLADLLFVSPSAMERYMDAAEKISRLAVGDASAPVMVNIYNLADEHPQNTHVDDLPFGTRGGAAIRSTFPLDGEYLIKVELAAATAHDPEQLEITVDGERAGLAGIEPRQPANKGTRAGRGPDSPKSRGPAPKPIEFRVPVKAGPRSIGVSFIERNEVRDEETLRPRMRSRGPLLAIATITISGPFRTSGPGDTPSRRRIFACRPASAADELPCARRILLELEHLAWRRPVASADLDPLMPFYEQGRKEGGFELGIERALERLLVSPQFLFRIERDPPGVAPGTPYKISDLELASRLSFFLWSSLPDYELLDAAASGKLREPGALEQQVKRMMADARSESLVTNFAEQWLFLRDLESKRPDDLLFPDYDESLVAAMRRETELFLSSVLRSGRSVLDLISGNYTFLNDRLARHYGIPGVQGSYFRKVTFPPESPRGGLLGQGSFLTITSYSTRTSPVVRGKWVLENLLSAAPPPPPPNIPALKTESPEKGKPLSMRAAMIQHRANPACAGCHARMDPIGFSMENFDAIGRWRDRDAAGPIDASGVLDGSKIEGVAGLKKALLAHPDEFVRTITERLLMFATGRNVQYYDAPAVRSIVRQAAAANYSFPSLILGVVKSVPFQMRVAQEEKRPAETTAMRGGR
jgi:mono/diheme cytochrome c family protein